MKAFFIYLLKLLLPIVVIIVLINMIVDPTHQISLNHKYESEILSILLEGHNATNVSNYNERILKAKLVQQYKGRHFNYVILGGSPVMQMSSDMYNNSQILNLGVSHGCFKDFIAFYEMTKEFDISMDTLILGVLPSFFNTTKGDDGWACNRTYYYHFTGKSEVSKSFSLLSAAAKMTGINSGMIKTLFSTDYFKTSVEWLLSGNLEALEPTDIVLNKGYTYYKDGSMSYSEKFRNNSVEDAEKYANTWRVEKEFVSDADTENVKIFESLVDDCLSRDIKMVLLMMPLHPIYYKRVYGSDVITEQESFIIRKADTLQIPLRGRCSPALSGYGAKDFMDQAHLKREVVRSFIQTHVFVENNIEN